MSFNIYPLCNVHKAREPLHDSHLYNDARYSGRLVSNSRASGREPWDSNGPRRTRRLASESRAMHKDSGYAHNCDTALVARFVGDNSALRVDNFWVRVRGTGAVYSARPKSVGFTLHNISHQKNLYTAW